MSFHDSIAHFFLELNNIPLSGCATGYLSIHLLNGTSVTFKILSVMNKAAKNIPVKFLCGHKFSIHLGK